VRGLCRRICQIAAGLILQAGAVTAFAAQECSAAVDDCVAVGSWRFSVALGAGDRTNPLVHSQDIPLFIVPQFSYYGKRFFIDNLDPGVTLLEGDSSVLSLVASPGYDRVFFYGSDPQNIFLGSTAATFAPHRALIGTRAEQQRALADRPRQITYLAGPEWTFKYAGMAGQLDYLHEITGRNHGDKVRAALGVRLGYLGGSWKATVGATWKSAAVVNYYYGGPGVYEPGPALDPFIKIGFSRPLSPRWTFDAFVDYEHLGASIGDSPIVARHYVTTGFFGVTYVFHE
jgi:outer membrane protein